jgi:tripartite-type tricarboxylate transporter receptor subunit TctC
MLVEWFVFQGRNIVARHHCLLAALGLSIATFSAIAQTNWPSKPIRIVVPFAPGGAADVMARIVAPVLTQNLGMPFIVDNKPGAGGVIGVDAVAKAAPDGYTLLLATNSQMAILPNITKTPYDPVKDFAPVSIIGTFMLALAVNEKLPAMQLADFVAHVKAHAGRIAYGTTGDGGIVHLTMALFAQRAGLDMIDVHYKGSPQTVTELLSGQIAACFCPVSTVIPYAAGGKLRLLAVSGERRSPQLPSVPTVAEQGYSGFRSEAWNGLMTPAKTPRTIIDRIAREIGAALKDANVIKRLQAVGIDPSGNTPDEFEKVLKDDLNTWRDAAKLAGTRPQ